jgi:hypothetical protein
MYNTYNIGSSRDQILLTVFITSQVPAKSKAIIIDPLNPAEWTPEVVKSYEDSGDIINKAIGTPSSLKGKRLSVTTVLAITGEDLETRKEAADRIVGDYLLERGLEGLKGFSNPYKIINDDATEVILSLNADLK